jgi:hypothetical protein
MIDPLQPLYDNIVKNIYNVARPTIAYVSTAGSVDNIMLKKNAQLPAAFLVDAGCKFEKDSVSRGNFRQTVTQYFRIAVFLVSTEPAQGNVISTNVATPTATIPQIRAALWSSILNWYPDTNLPLMRSATPIYAVEDMPYENDQGYLGHIFTFAWDYIIQEEDGWQYPVTSLVEIDVTTTRVTNIYDPNL